MGNSGSSNNANNLPRGSSNSANNLPCGVTKITDSLYELYSPPQGENVEFKVIFFHGLMESDYTNAFWDTWAGDGGIIRLLSAEFPKSRLFSVSFDSCAKESNKGGRVDLTIIAENLISDIIGQLGKEQCPVILVGYSVGGFVIKKFIIDARVKMNRPKRDERQFADIEEFLGNLCGIFYYSTPHSGTKLADCVAKLPGSSEVLRFLKVLSKDMARLNEGFREWRAKTDIPAFTITESLPTDFKNWGVKGRNSIVVEEASARQDTDDFYTVAKDHFGVCKASDKTDSSYLLLDKFIQNCL